MAAFLVIDIQEVRDESEYAKYRELVPSQVIGSGGRYLVRGGPVEVLEGNWRPTRVVVLRFDSAEDARKWWSAPAYAELKAMRQHSTTANMILLEGVESVQF
jgi:uncharacterized protein (DUF1330 family)